MPRGDGTGPLGIGPMTGKGLGNCVTSNYNGIGRGFRRMNYWVGTPGCFRDYYFSRVGEEEALKYQEELLQNELLGIRQRLEEIKEKS
jgi:hypothetical protein